MPDLEFVNSWRDTCATLPHGPDATCYATTSCQLRSLQFFWLANAFSGPEVV
jgi:hypothetical protein